MPCTLKCVEQTNRTRLNTSPSRCQRPLQLLLLLRHLLRHRQRSLTPQSLDILQPKRVPEPVDLIELAKLQRAVGVNRRPHVQTARHVLGAFEVLDGRHVGQSGLDFRQRRRVGHGREGVPAVDHRPEARQRVTVDLRRVVVDRAHVHREDHVRAEALHVRHRQVVDVAAVAQHAAFVADRGDQTRQRHRRPHVPPDVPRRVILRPRATQVGRVAVELQPEILDLAVAKGLEDAPIEFVARRVRHRRVRQVQRKPPHAAHAAGELLGPAVHRHHVGLPGVQGPDERADRGAADDIDGDARLLQGFDHPDVRDPAGTPAAQHQPHGAATETAGEPVEVPLEGRVRRVQRGLPDAPRRVLLNLGLEHLHAMLQHAAQMLAALRM